MADTVVLIIDLADHCELAGSVACADLGEHRGIGYVVNLEAGAQSGRIK